MHKGLDLFKNGVKKIEPSEGGRDVLYKHDGPELPAVYIVTFLVICLHASR